MTTYVEARDALVASLNSEFSANYPTLKVVYENAEKVDINDVGDQFVKITIDFLAARQATIEFAPHSRVLGEVVLQFSIKEGKGTRWALSLFDFVCDKFAYRQIGGVTMRTPAVTRKREADGWLEMDFSVPFIFDSTS